VAVQLQAAEERKLLPLKESPGITKEDFTTIKVIGTGTYGKVVLVKKKDTN
jgi:hypothetical protein